MHFRSERRAPGPALLGRWLAAGAREADASTGGPPTATLSFGAKLRGVRHFRCVPDLRRFFYRSSIGFERVVLGENENREKNYLSAWSKTR